MALDGLFLRTIKYDLEPLIGSRVDKIYQPSGEELVICLRSRSMGSVKVLLSARANSPRVSITESTFENPAAPPMLCMLLRKRLGGAALTAVRQQDLDRILFLDFNATNELGDKENLTVAVEIMAQYSNVILVGADGKIIDALKRVDLTKSSKRLILPGLPYELPPKQDKLDILSCSLEELIVKVKSFTGKTLSSALLASIMGISPVAAREIAFRAVGEDKYVSELTDDDFIELEYPLLDIKQAVTKGAAKFTVVRDENGKPFDFSFIDILQYGSLAEKEYYDSPSCLLDDYYSKRDSMERIAQKTASLRKFLNTLRERTARKIETQRIELAKSVDRENLRISAELINANLFRLEKGQCLYALENYYDDNKIMQIRANPALSPAANAQKYYKDYRKTYNAEKKLKEQIENGLEELAYIESVLDALSRVNSEREIAVIRSELVQQGYLRNAHVKSQKNSKVKQAKQPAALPPIEYKSTDGYRILVGRNNLQNDKLSLKTANKLDMWLHTQDFPGSHVIIENKEGNVSDKAIEEAAVIAAVNSTVSQAGKVSVDYTLAKYLKKPAGAKPGKVIYRVYNTISVIPDAAFAESLKCSK